MRSTEVALLLLAVAACGDNVLVDRVTDAVSGTRIKVQRYRYDDGAEQAEPFEYYDAHLHTTCRAVTWADGIVRCGPVADAALYTDAACTAVAGRATTIEHPTHFVGYDVIDGAAIPTRVYTAGASTTAPASYYERQDGSCAGPFAAAPEASYFEATDERTGDALEPLRDGELGEGRLGVRTVESDDGLRVPIGFYDRELAVDCAPESRADGSVWCAPSAAVAATRFADASCSAPVVVADARPAFASISDAAGCASYAAVGEPVTGPLFRRDGDACVPSGDAGGFAVGSPIEPAALERSLARGGKRLARIVLDTGELRVHADPLFDTATRADCRRQVLASETANTDIVRCIPRTADAQLLYTRGCTVAVPVVELPQRTCGSVGFATTTSDVGLDIHAIGDPMADALFEPSPFGCRPHTVAADATLHALGPALPPEAFVGAIYFGER